MLPDAEVDKACQIYL